MTLLELLQLIKKHRKMVVILPIVCALAMGGYSFLFMKNTYTAQTSMYILTRSSGGETANSTDLSASQMIANDVAALLDSDIVKRNAARNLSLDSLSDYEVSVANESTSRVITLSVNGADPDGVARVANAMAQEVSSVAQEVQMAESINVIDRAEVPEEPSGPNRLIYTAVAFMGGLFAAVAIIVCMDMLNTRVRGVEDAEELLGVPVIGRIPAVKGEI